MVVLMHEIPISSKGPNGCNALFCKTRKEMQATSGRSSPVTSCTLVLVQKRVGICLYPENPKGKCDELVKQVMMCVVQIRISILKRCVNFHKDLVNARCPHHRSTRAQPQIVGVLHPMPFCLGIGGHPSGSWQGHPRYSGARTTGRPWVAHTNAQRAKCTCHDAYSRQSNTQVFPNKTCISTPVIHQER